MLCTGQNWLSFQFNVLYSRGNCNNSAGVEPERTAEIGIFGCDDTVILLGIIQKRRVCSCISFWQFQCMDSAMPAILKNAGDTSGKIGIDQKIHALTKLIRLTWRRSVTRLLVSAASNSSYLHGFLRWSSPELSVSTHYRVRRSRIRVSNAIVLMVDKEFFCQVNLLIQSSH